MPQPTDHEPFADWLKRSRRALHISQDELAARVGCTPSMLQKLEQGVRRPSQELAARLAAMLAVAPTDRAPLLHLDSAAPALRAAGSDAGASPSAQAGAGPKALPLLLTKILPPPLPRQVVARQRLARQLLQSRDGGVTLVVAPAGWGKTTLLADWLSNVKRRT